MRNYNKRLLDKLILEGVCIDIAPIRYLCVSMCVWVHWLNLLVPLGHCALIGPLIGCPSVETVAITRICVLQKYLCVTYKQSTNALAFIDFGSFYKEDGQHSRYFYLILGSFIICTLFICLSQKWSSSSYY